MMEKTIYILPTIFAIFSSYISIPYTLANKSVSAVQESSLL